MVEGVAHPGGAQPVRRQALVILQPQLLILKRVYFAKLPAQVPGQGIDPAPLFHILDNDGEIGFFAQERFQPGINRHEACQKFLVIVQVAEVVLIVRIKDIQLRRGAALLLSSMRPWHAAYPSKGGR